MDHIHTLLREHHLLTYNLSGIQFLTLSQQDGLSFAKEALYRLVDKQTVLFLSGGRTPKEFYQQLATEEKLIPGAVGLVDERYGDRMHESSNEKMIADSGFTRYLQMRDIPYYPILSSSTRHSEEMQQNLNPSQSSDNRFVMASRYDERLRELFQKYRKSIGLLGIGLDGHTAGIPADPTVWEEYEIEKRSKTEYVIEYDDHGPPSGGYNQRISMSFLGLSMLDVLIVLCFGKDKKPALEKMLSEGSENEIPSRFYKRIEMVSKTIIITDQIL